MDKKTALRFAAAILLSAVTAVQADIKLNPSAEVLWIEDFDTLALDNDRNSGWSVGDPPGCSVSAKDGVMTMAEIGEKSWAYVQRYVAYDLASGGQGYPYLQVRIADDSAPFELANASTGGGEIAAKIQGPGLFSFDLRQFPALVESKKGQFCLSFCCGGPDGHNPGPGSKIDWIRNTSSAKDHIVVRLEDSQPDGQPGHGFASVGDKISFSVNTSSRCKNLVFKLIDTRSGQPVTIDGRTEFPAPYDPDSMGQSWSATVPVTERSATGIKTWTLQKGEILPGNENLAVVAEITDGPYPRLMTTPSFGLDLDVGRASGASQAKDPQSLLQGNIMLESNFDKGEDSSWRIVAGDRWVFQDGLFGDVSDAEGPDGLGNWAEAGENGWSDYSFEADVAKELDGIGLFSLAVRFQDPRNYYAVDWTCEESLGDTLTLVRCVDGQRFEIAKAAGLSLDKLPFHLGISVSGDYLAVSLNGQQVAAGYAGDFEKGKVAIGEKQRKVLVDNAKVTRIVSAGKVSRFLRDLRFEYVQEPRYFLRDAGEIVLPFSVVNKGEKPLENVRIEISFELASSPYPWGGSDQDASARPPFEPFKMDLAKIEKGTTMIIEYPIDTRLLKQGEYLLRTRASVPKEGLSKDGAVWIGIARNWNPERFNYFSWGLPEDEAGIRDYAEHGHTAGFAQVGGRGSELEWKHKGNPVPESELPARQGQAGLKPTKFSTFDYCLKYGIIGGVNLQSNHGSHFPEETRGKFKNNAHGCVLPYHPLFREFSINFAKTYARKFGAYPACRIFGINTETEFELQPDFSPVGLERAQRLFGGPPPEGCVTCDGIPGDQAAGMVKDGIVDDDHPVARYYRWFWNEGEGYNVLAREMAAAIREVNPDILTFHDPAARCPAIRDRHDGLNPWDWTYTNPNALTVPYKTEVLRAMAKPPFNIVCNYVQVLWKRGVASPKDECPSAAILRLGLLYTTSRPVFAGHWNTEWMLAEANLDRWEAVKDLHETLWRPLGPVLTGLTDPPREIAFLISYNNMLFQFRDRQSPWSADCLFAAWHEAFMRAGIPVDVVFEEDVADGKLSKYRAVFIPGGQLIGRKAHEQLVTYAKDGGRVVADNMLGYQVPGVETLSTSLQPLNYQNWSYASGHKVSAQDQIDIVWKASDEISKVFSEIRSQKPVSDSKWLVVNGRQWEGIPYVFAINDHRSAGTQIGQYGVMFENGEPLTASITFPCGDEPRFIYDLVSGSEVKAEKVQGGLRWSREYAPASGVLFAVLDQKIDRLQIEVPEQPVPAGKQFTITAKLLDPSGAPVRGRLPLRLTVRDSQGSLSEYSDIFAFKNGIFEKTGTVALNDSTGTWSVRIDDLTTGRSALKYFKTVPSK